MPTTPEAITIMREHGISLLPGKAANAGGVAVSGLEMSQNAQHLSWTSQEVDMHLQKIMKSIHSQCLEAASTYGKDGDYISGSNIAGFLKVSEAMQSQGVI